MELIKLRELNKHYDISGGKKVHALKDVSLDINEGDFVAIRGRSGAGKSTLLHILGCLDNFGGGSYYLADKDISSLSDGQAAKLRNEQFGFVLQDFSLISHRSVLFNVTLPLYFTKGKLSAMKPAARDVLRAVGIEDQIKKKAGQLSGGQKQRVAIARALINSPKVIFADEPTGALDSETSTQIMDIFKKLNEEKGITIVVVTHDDLVSSYCSRIVEIADGVIV